MTHFSEDEIMGLKEYWQKRNFKETSEPKGQKIHKGKKPLQFVVQKHHASHLHYDFRLEAEGVLKSWAVPKGPSMNPADKRLAIQVEDHPFEYRTFEGTIPEGSYGAGTVIVWDAGNYEAAGSNSRKESEDAILQGLENGVIHFVLQGHKLQGEFTLMRLKNNDKQWLLLKKNDDWATQEDITQHNRSVLSNKTLEEISGKETIPSKTSKTSKTAKKSSLEASVKEKRTQSKEKKLDRTEMPHAIKPMLATLVDEPFDGPDWIFEIKWDGYRALAELDKSHVLLYSRNNQSFNRFLPVVEDLKKLKVNALLDGEIVILDENGIPSFQLIQNYQRKKTGNLIYYVFDLLYLEGHDIRSLPLLKRKELLKDILPNMAHVRYCDHIEQKGKNFFQVALEKGLEGIVAKAILSPYQQGRSHQWLKIKTHKRQEVIICGFTSPKGSRKYFGALILGIYEEGELVYVGHTGSGFDRKKLATIYNKLDPLIQSSCPFKEVPKTNASVTWVRPELICEVKFAEWTDDGQMRQPIFIEFREDKKPEEVIKENALPTNQALKEDDQVVKSKKSKNTNANVDPTTVQLTNLNKIYWPDEEYTKGDLINYYKEVSSYILPYLKDRPETLHRYPNGIKGSSFYQKDVETNQLPSWLRIEQVKHENRLVDYILVENQDSLLYLVNLGCIEMNPFNSRIQSLDYPDYLILDLDPEDIDFEAVIETARAIHHFLDSLDIIHLCKTSGSTGLHIYIPMGAQYTFKQVSQFAQVIAHLVHNQIPDITSLERHPHKRQKCVYIDYLQNNFGQTVAAPYCVRPKPGATVSTPLKWSEVKSGLDPSQFTIKTVMKRFKKLGDLFLPVLGPGINLSKSLKEIENNYTPSTSKVGNFRLSKG